METDVAVLAERRAKMARLRSEHFVAGRDVTSAPRVTSVDEFSQVRDGRENVDEGLLLQAPRSSVSVILLALQKLMKTCLYYGRVII